MEAVIASLAAQGAALIVKAAATDVWPSIKAGIARLMHRAGQPKDRADSTLELTRSQLLEADSSSVELTAEWRGRLLGILETNPDLVTELRRLLTEQGPAVEAAAAGSTTVHQTVTVSDSGQAFNVGAGNISVENTRPSMP